MIALLSQNDIEGWKCWRMKMLKDANVEGWKCWRMKMLKDENVEGWKCVSDIYYSTKMNAAIIRKYSKIFKRCLLDVKSSDVLQIFS